MVLSDSPISAVVGPQAIVATAARPKQDLGKTCKTVRSATEPVMLYGQEANDLQSFPLLALTVVIATAGTVLERTEIEHALQQSILPQRMICSSEEDWMPVGAPNSDRGVSPLAREEGVGGQVR